MKLSRGERKHRENLSTRSNLVTEIMRTISILKRSNRPRNRFAKENRRHLLHTRNIYFFRTSDSCGTAFLTLSFRKYSPRARSSNFTSPVRVNASSLPLAVPFAALLLLVVDRRRPSLWCFSHCSWPLCTFPFLCENALRTACHNSESGRFVSIVHCWNVHELRTQKICCAYRTVVSFRFVFAPVGKVGFSSAKMDFVHKENVGSVLPFSGSRFVWFSDCLVLFWLSGLS